MQYQLIPLAVRVDGTVLAYVQLNKSKSKDAKKTSRKRPLPSTSEPVAPVEQVLTSSPTPLATARAQALQTSPKAKRRRKDFSNPVPSSPHSKHDTSQHIPNTWGMQHGSSGMVQLGSSGMVQFGHSEMGQPSHPGTGQPSHPGMGQSGQSGFSLGTGQSGLPPGIGQLGPSGMYNMSVPVQYQLVQLPQGIPSGMQNYSHPGATLVYNGSSHVPSHYIQSPATPFIQYAVSQPQPPQPPPASISRPTSQHGPHSHHTFWS